MITEHDLHEAIAECQGERNPNAHTCAKLASYFTILDHMTQKEQTTLDKGYSYSSNGNTDVVNIETDTEFSRAINGRSSADMWPVMDELMSTLQVTNPRLYSSVMRRIE